jgi:OOP family OmpA-OmpF porin
MFKQIAVAAALVIASSSALAQQPATQFYVGAEVSSTKLEDISGSENGFGGFVGFKVNQNIAVEAGFNRLADVDEDGANLTADQTSISVIGTLPLSNGFSAFGRLGYNEVKAKISYDGESESGKDDGAVYGLGLGYAFSPAITGRVEVSKPFSDVTKVSAGVAFHF